MKNFIVIILFLTFATIPVLAVDQDNCINNNEDILTKEQATEQLRPSKEIQTIQNYEQNIMDNNEAIPYQDIEPEQNMFTQNQSDYDDEPYNPDE